MIIASKYMRNRAVDLIEGELINDDITIKSGYALIDHCWINKEYKIGYDECENIFQYIPNGLYYINDDSTMTKVNDNSSLIVYNNKVYKINNDNIEDYEDSNIITPSSIIAPSSAAQSNDTLSNDTQSSVNTKESDKNTESYKNEIVQLNNKINLLNKYNKIYSIIFNSIKDLINDKNNSIKNRDKINELIECISLIESLF